MRSSMAVPRTPNLSLRPSYSMPVRVSRHIARARIARLSGCAAHDACADRSSRACITEGPLRETSTRMASATRPSGAPHLPPRPSTRGTRRTPGSGARARGLLFGGGPGAVRSAARRRRRRRAGRAERVCASGHVLRGPSLLLVHLGTGVVRARSLSRARRGPRVDAWRWPRARYWRGG